jgi:2-isopropylmalate synthase
VLSSQALADKKKGITDEDLLALVGDEVHQAAVVWELVDLQVRLPRQV